ncbi:hypothetical protein SAMN02745866_03815 [Alteromonadaceae bacterium Bs31]|nr:hypothetical protein SAMN02745866_03815 [Alteromonadaceae bacterium Bs31]
MELSFSDMTQHNLPQFVEALKQEPATLSKLSFCPSKKTVKVREWAEEMRATQTSATSAALYKALPEFARLKIDTETRLEMLDQVRPLAQHTIEGLTREFLNRPINASEDAHRSAIIAQALQKAMIDGYAKCVEELCSVKRFRPTTKELLARSLHRAISGISHLFFRSYQLYIEQPEGFWHKLHALFQIADYFDLLANSVLDPMLKTTRATNLQTAYMRVLVMATAKLNQLKHNDISYIYDGLETWAQYTRLHPSNYQDSDLFYLVNISSDLPPIYRSRFEGKSSDRVLQLNFKVLVSLLSKLSPNESSLSTDSHGSLTLPKGFPLALLDHLTSCWSSISQRQQERRSVQGKAEICIGLVNVHSCICDQSFDDFVEEDLSAGYSQDVMDVFSPAEDEDKAVHKSSAPRHEVSVQNVSSGGYCLLWKKDMPQKLQAGELIAMKEKGRHSWTVGVIRWLRQFKESSQLGIQILGNHPKAFGAGQMYDMGGYADYMRAIYVPAAKNGKMPASILTSSAPFKEGDKVKVYDGEKSFKARLTRKLFSTTSVQQFAYQPIEVAQGDGSSNKPNKKAGTQGFDNNWE